MLICSINLFMIDAQVSKQSPTTMVLFNIYKPYGVLEMYTFSMQLGHEISNATAAS